MTCTIVLLGEPKSTQHIYRSACRGSFPTTYMTPEGKALKVTYQWETREQWSNETLKGEIEIWVTFYFGTKRRADLDNFNKLSLDALSGIVYEDDSQIAKDHHTRAYDKERPRIEITVRPLVEPTGLQARTT